MPTKVYRVKGPDGKIHKIEGPEGASEAEILEAANKLVKAGEDKERSTPMGKVRAFGRGAVGGLLMNWEDEIGGTLNAVMPPSREQIREGRPNIWLGDDFSTAQAENIEAERRINRADERVNPKIRGAGEVTGAVGSLFIGGPAVKGTAAAATRIAPK